VHINRTAASQTPAAPLLPEVALPSAPATSTRPLGRAQLPVNRDLAANTRVAFRAGIFTTDRPSRRESLESRVRSQAGQPARAAEALSQARTLAANGIDPVKHLQKLQGLGATADGEARAATNRAAREFNLPGRAAIHVAEQENSMRAGVGLAASLLNLLPVAARASALAETLALSRSALRPAGDGQSRRQRTAKTGYDRTEN
jgi:hypothetical protein